MLIWVLPFILGRRQHCLPQTYQHWYGKLQHSEKYMVYFWVFRMLVFRFLPRLKQPLCPCNWSYLQNWNWTFGKTDPEFQPWVRIEETSAVPAHRWKRRKTQSLVGKERRDTPFTAICIAFDVMWKKRKSSVAVPDIFEWDSCTIQWITVELHQWLGP